ncbi:ion channel [Leptolyngbya sp. AN03gr2]|uniref:ion channel n=1 Tax=unclassified Leptolyngbya TaxID=2650499 RepID=UPI003D31749D
MRLRHRKHRRIKIHVEESGRFQIVGMNAWYSYWRDPYHLVLTVPWMGFFAIVVGVYLGINVVFAWIYLLGGDCIANATPGSFVDYFFFSIQTFATIGYGAMYPKTVYAQSIMTIESLVSMVAIAILTGFTFARFSRPTARVAFSQVATIAPHEGVPTLSFRAANQRRNQILEAQMRVYLLRDEITSEGHYIRRIHDLALVRSQTPGFALTWLVMHPIDENSPLYGMSPESMSETNCLIQVMLSGIDETVAQVLHDRHVYVPQEILWNYRFVDLVYKTPEGHRFIDYQHFHDAEPIP